MKKIVTEKGHSVLLLAMSELLDIASPVPVCDSCVTPISSSSYYIPLLHSVYCRKCFSEWCERTVFYEEDRIYERHKLKQITDKIASKNKKGGH